MRVVVRNITWLLLSQLASWGASIVMLIAAPRYLGDTDYGTLQFAGVLVLFAQLVAGLGTDTYIVKVTARDESRVGRYVFNTLVMKVLLSVTLSALVLGLAYVLGYRGVFITLMAVFCAGMTMAVLTSTVVAGLQGLQQMGHSAAAAAVQVIASNGLGLIVLVRRGGLVLYALALTSGAVIPLVVNTWKFWPHLRSSLRLDFGLWKGIARGGLPFLMFGAIFMVYGSIDLPILGSLAGSTTVGWYSVAYRWVGLPAFFASIVATAILPSLSSRFETFSMAFTRQANQAIRLVYLVGAPIATGFILVADDRLRVLYPNSGFDHAVPVMQVLALHLPIVTVTMIIGAVLIASDRQNRWVAVGALAAVLNIGLNFIAIPWSMHAFGNGAIGAALITVLTEFVMLAGAIYLRPAGILDRATAKNLLRCTIACVAMVPPVLAIHADPVFVKVVVGVFTFAAGTILLRVVTLDDVRTGFSHGFRSTQRVA